MLRYGGQRCAKRFHRRATARCWSLTSSDLRRTRRCWCWRLRRRRRNDMHAASKKAWRRAGLTARGWRNQTCWRFWHGVDIEHRGWFASRCCQRNAEVGTELRDPCNTRYQAHRSCSCRCQLPLRFRCSWCARFSWRNRSWVCSCR